MARHSAVRPKSSLGTLLDFAGYSVSCDGLFKPVMCH